MDLSLKSLLRSFDLWFILLRICRKFKDETLIRFEYFKWGYEVFLWERTSPSETVDPNTERVGFLT